MVKPETAAVIIKEYQDGLLTAFEAIKRIRNMITTEKEVVVLVPKTSTVYNFNKEE